MCVNTACSSWKTCRAESRPPSPPLTLLHSPALLHGKIVKHLYVCVSFLSSTPRTHTHIALGLEVGSFMAPFNLLSLHMWLVINRLHQVSWGVL